MVDKQKMKQEICHKTRDEEAKLIAKEQRRHAHKHKRRKNLSRDGKAIQEWTLLNETEDQTLQAVQVQPCKVSCDYHNKNRYTSHTSKYPDLERTLLPASPEDRPLSKPDELKLESDSSSDSFSGDDGSVNNDHTTKLFPRIDDMFVGSSRAGDQQTPSEIGSDSIDEKNYHLTILTTLLNCFQKVFLLIHTQPVANKIPQRLRLLLVMKRNKKVFS